MNRVARISQNRNIKRLFTSKQCKVLNAMNEADKKTIASDIVERMTNIKDNPLLLQVQNQRRKLQRQMKELQKRAKPIQDLPRKVKKEDMHILIRNHAEK